VGAFLLVVYPVMGFILLVGGVFGLPVVETQQWGGLMVTLVVAGVGIAASLPIGVVLALGRRSTMPVIRAICTAFIEIVRGVPLISILFMASVMLPMFLPEGMNFDKLLRALVGVTLFAGAYMAEVVRGGLQAIPRGQFEAAAALGLGYWRMMGLVILPQALRIVIPGIVNTFIGLFKDTTLVLIIGLSINLIYPIRPPLFITHLKSSFKEQAYSRHAKAENPKDNGREDITLHGKSQPIGVGSGSPDNPKKIE